MNKLTALLTIAILLTSILAPATTLALISPQPQVIGTPQLSKTEVYIGPNRTIKITIYDDDPINMTINKVDRTGINVTIYTKVKELNTTAKDKIYAFVSILIGGEPLDLAEVYNVTSVNRLINNVTLLNLTETGNDTKTFTATLIIEPANETDVDTINGTSKIYVSPQDVAKGIIINITYPDLVGGELEWISRIFEIKVEAPSIEVDKREVVPGQNFTITLIAQSLNLDSKATDYIAVNNETGEVYWVTSEGKIQVGFLNITVVDSDGKIVAANLTNCTVGYRLVLAEKLKLYEETGVNTATFEIPVSGKCIRDAVPGMTEGYKINVTYTDFYTNKTVYVEIPVRKITVSLKASMYYKGKLVVEELEKLPLIKYSRYAGPTTQPKVAGFNYTLNITVYDPAYIDDVIKVEIYNVTNGLEANFTVKLNSTGEDVRYAKIKVNITKTKIIFYYYNGTHNDTRTVNIADVYQYPVAGRVKVVYADKYTLTLPIALPKDDMLSVTPTTLDRVAGNVTLRFLFGDLPVVPEDLAIEVKWTSRDGRAYTFYFNASQLGMNLTTGVAEINITRLLAEKVDEFENETVAARAIVGTTVTFAYKDPATRFNAG